MALDIEAALRDGFQRTTDTNGLTIAGAFFVLGALSAISAGSGANFGGPMFPGPQLAPISLPPLLAGLISLLAGIATIVLTIGALRLFVGETLAEIPRELFSRNMVMAWLNFFIGSIVFGIVVGVGFVLLVVPGVFLLVSLVFWAVFVAVDDQNFINAFKSSWRLVRGHRWMLFGLGFAVLIIILVVNAIFGGIGSLIRGLIGLLVAQVGSALTTTFSLAVLAHAFNQLSTMEDEEELEEE